LAVPAILSLLLATSLPGTVAASWPWLADCSGNANSEYLCIFRDRDLKGNIAHMAGSYSNYVGDTYPSSTNLVDNSVSSTENLYGSHDVTWHWSINNGGNGFCVNHNTAVLWVGLFDNDVFSSHQVSDDGAC
jgi:hypothetical protein